MFEAFLSPLAIILSLCTTTGVLLHETKVDKVASLALLSSISTGRYVAAEAGLETTPHTHVEHTQVSRASSDFHGGNPGIPPRRDDKKFHTQKRVPKGFHVFDSYFVPAG